MSQPIRFCLVLHNHQPIGNFDGVFEQAYQDSYLPFLEVFEPYEPLRISLHTSGPLLEWLDAHHPEYLDRLAALVAAGRVEIVGGAFYEPILTMINRRDRVGQISDFTTWLERRLGGRVQGMWMPERVWEQSLTVDIAESGIRYTVLDDFHFKNAGLDTDQLYGYYVTEDEGRLVSVFPGSERLRYLIPFADPRETINYLGHIHQNHEQAVVVFGDDGEKFGTWPDTRQHVYDNGWLRQFFDVLTENAHWIDTTTLAEAADEVSPLGKVYLPDASYREMTEWSLPVAQQVNYDNLVHEFEHDGRWERLKRFIRGGYWRNFKVKYPESNEMYTRMLQVSRRLQQAEAAEATDEAGSNDLVRYARQALYRGQCNCSYWHGAFGGIYLPHLRNAVYNQLIAADNLLDQAADQAADRAGDGAADRARPRIEATADDYNLDGRQEVRLANDRLIAYVAPAAGGQLYELDVRSICLNLLASLARRPEAYHRKVLAGPSSGQGDCASIHDRVVFKQEGLDQRLQYDHYLRKSLLDHIYDADVSLDAVARGEARELGDFLHGVFETKIRRSPERIQVQLSRTGKAAGHTIRITKGLTLQAGSSTLEVAYLLEQLPPRTTLHLASEWNFAGLPAGADDRYFFQGGERLGHLGSELNLTNASELGLADQWLGIQLNLRTNRPTHFWTYPVQSVSQSEGGFELVHQSVAVVPHWQVQADAEGRWSVSFQIDVDTQWAESRIQGELAAASR